MPETIFEKRRLANGILYERAAQDAIEEVIPTLLKKHGFERKEDVIKAKTTGSDEEKERASKLIEEAELIADSHMVAMHKTDSVRSQAVQHTIELENKAERDPLTELLRSPEAIFNRWQIERGHFLRDQELNILVVVEFDLDHFKAVNDTRGHTFVDKEILQKLANKLREQFREVDIICRHGGDEFGLVFSARAENDIKRLLIRLNNTIRSIYDGITGSIGVTVYNKEETKQLKLTSAEDYAQLVRQPADRAMYRAKQGSAQRPGTHGDSCYQFINDTEFKEIIL